MAKNSAHITAIEFVRQDAFYDLSVWPHQNYWMDGIWHHNSGTSEIALAKVAKFVLSEQPPPRPDTPFWIISNTFQQVCEVAWKEKLLGHGHIPAAEVDWERIKWKSELNGWPLTVPLKPWVGELSKNWTLEFKSYKEGRQQMQARAIGGFCFIEQFPWPLLTEVLRGCREYSFRGNKICEFTPVEPGLTEELEDMLERDQLPPGWEVYRMNTQCAYEAGHVAPEWFHEFFAMVPESMRETRMTGAMPTYEGAIYSTFNPKIHVIDIQGWMAGKYGPRPVGIRHRRSLDWGSGPENAMAGIWYFSNSVGQYFIYDEYYSTDLTKSVIDHLCVIQDQWPWPEDSPHYGVTWADPSAVGYLRIASRLSEYAPKDPETGKPLYQNMDIVGARNDVTPGIEHVQYMLKQQPGLEAPFPGLPRLPGGYPRLFIDRGCRNLKRELRTYRWDTGSETAVNKAHRPDRKPQPLKKQDHLCVKIGSLIDTPNGPKPIELLKDGEPVYSHLGVAELEGDSAKTGREMLIEVELEDARTILCTANHPLRTSEGKWIPAEQACGQILQVRRGITETEMERLSSVSNTQVSFGDGIQNQGIIRCGITAELSGDVGNYSISGCTRKSTRTFTGRFQRDMSSITRTKTTGTIIPTISKLLRKSGTQNIIAETCKRLWSWPNFGTNLRPDEVGIVSTPSKLPKIENIDRSNVLIAESDFGPRTEGLTRGFVAIDAGIMPVFQGEMTTCSDYAKSADQHSRLTVMRRRQLAPINVVGKRCLAVRRLDGKEPVYNLATSDGTFFVNGVLVSNCDSLRYGLFSEAEWTVSDQAHIHRPDRFETHGIQFERGTSGIQLHRRR